MKRFVPYLLVVLVLCTAAICRPKKQDPTSGTLHLVGDSACCPYPEKSRPQTGWGELIGAKLGDKAVVHNYAIGGQSTKSFIDRGFWDKAIAAVGEKDLMLIQFGGNDQKKDVAAIYTDPEGSFSDNLKRFISETRAKGGIPVLVTSPSRRHFDASGKARRTFGAYPAAMRKVAAETDTPLIDAEEMTYQWVNKLGPEASRQYYMLSVNGSDSTHFTHAGAEIVAGMIAGELRKLGLWK